MDAFGSGATEGGRGIGDPDTGASSRCSSSISKSMSKETSQPEAFWLCRNRPMSCEGGSSITPSCRSEWEPFVPPELDAGPFNEQWDCTEMGLLGRSAYKWGVGKENWRVCSGVDVAGERQGRIETERWRARANDPPKKRLSLRRRGGSRVGEGEETGGNKTVIRQWKELALYVHVDSYPIFSTHVDLLKPVRAHGACVIIRYWPDRSFSVWVG